MKIQIKNCKESPELMPVHINLYNNGGESLRIDTEKYQFVLSGVNEWHAKRMIFQIEQYIKDSRKFLEISELRMLSQHEIEQKYIEYSQTKQRFNSKGEYDSAEKYTKILDEMINVFEYLPC